MPLLKQLLEDVHPGVRAGAVAALGDIYTADSDEYRTELTPALAGTLAAGLWLIPRFGTDVGFKIVALVTVAPAVGGLLACTEP